MAIRDEEEREENENDSERAETDEETNASDGEDRATDKQESTATHEEDEEQWKRYQEEAKKEQQLDTKVKESHPVHCPYYGEVSPTRLSMKNVDSLVFSNQPPWVVKPLILRSFTLAWFELCKFVYYFICICSLYVHVQHISIFMLP